jgi:glycosyltransferase involved in cell wall biosynthesis
MKLTKQQMVSVGIPIEKTPWTGGINYLKSLVLAANSVMEESQVRISIITGVGNASEAKSHFPGNEVIESRWLGKISVSKILRILTYRVVGTDYFLSDSLAKRGVHLLSHGPPLGESAAIPSINWIPDFQHIHLPQYFQKKTLKQRDVSLRNACKNATTIVLSSQSALNDFSRLAPQSIRKAKVLRFVSLPPQFGIEGKEAITSKLGINKRRFLFMPNQMWIHKNHILVFKAIAELVKSNPDILLVTSGEKSDFRNPNHPESLERYVTEHRLQQNIKILGSIKYEEVAALFSECHGVINPSKFEGWSTSVEEAKSFGKPLLLSNLDVHREQARENAHFFSVDSISECVSAIEVLWKQPQIELDKNRIHTEYQKRQCEFGREFVNIVQDSLATHKRRS